MACILAAILVALALSGGGSLSPNALLPATFAALILLAVSRSTVQRGKILWYGNLCLLVYICVTLIPLPTALLGSTRGAAFRRVDQAVAALDEARLRDAVPRPNSVGRAVAAEAEHRDAATAASAVRVHPRLTLSTAGTVRSLFLAAGMFALFWVSAGCSNVGKRRLLLSLVVVGAGVAIAGVIGRYVFPQGKTVLWSVPVAVGNPMGPFVNRNHFALFCALLVPVALVLAGSPSCDLTTDARPRRLSLFSVSCIAAVCFALLAGGALLSLSRGGILSLLAGIAATALFSVKARPLSATVTAAFAVAFFIGLLLWPHQEGRRRIETLTHAVETHSAQTRFTMWRDAASVWRDVRLAGAGFGSFRTVYPMYKTAPTRKGALHCENEYLQILADGGVFGAGLAGFLVLTYLTHVAAALRRASGDHGGDGDDGAPNREDLALRARAPQPFGRMAVGVLAVLAVNFAFDFGGRIPLNAFAAALILGTTLPTVRGGARRSVHLRRSFWNQRLQACVLMIGMAALALAFWPRAWRLDRDDALQESAFEDLVVGVAWAPIYWMPWYESGRRMVNSAIADAPKPEDVRDSAIARLGVAHIRQAAEYNPLNHRLWAALASAESHVGNDAGARRAAVKVLELAPWQRQAVADYLDDRKGQQ